jgi:hypothetical protein
MPRLPAAWQAIFRGLAAGIGIVLGVVPLAAQDTLPDTVTGPRTERPVPSLGPEGWVEGAILAGVGVTTLRGTGVAVAHLAGQIALGPRLRIGAEAVLPLDGARLAAEGSSEGSAVYLGYGGARVEVLPGASRWTAGVLLGAGTARVRTPGGSDLANRNFLVVEPGVRLSTGTLGPLRHGVALSGRIPLGSPALPGVRKGDLYGISISLTTEWVRDP